MASRRCLQAVARHATSLFSSTSSVHRLKTPHPLAAPFPPKSLFEARQVSPGLEPNRCPPWPPRARLFCSNGKSEEEEEDESDGEGGEVMEESDCETGKASSRSKWDYTPEEREAEATAIGYAVLGPLEKSDRVFKPHEPVFAVVQVRRRWFLRVK